MKEVIFVTGNRHKAEEIGKVLQPYGITVVQKELDIDEPYKTVEENAVHKAKAAFKKFNRPLFVEDTGFFFTALDNFPGAHPKRVFEEIGFKGLLEKLEGKDRSAYAKVVICFIDSDNNTRRFEGVLNGRITEEVFGEEIDVMPYEKIFIPDGHDKPLVFMSREEKNAFSHRAVAAKKLGDYLKTVL